MATCDLSHRAQKLCNQLLRENSKHIFNECNRAFNRGHVLEIYRQVKRWFSQRPDRLLLEYSNSVFHLYKIKRKDSTLSSWYLIIPKESLYAKGSFLSPKNHIVSKELFNTCLEWGFWLLMKFRTIQKDLLTLFV